MLGTHHDADFVKSTHSDPNNCVYVARPSVGTVGVRDGKAGPTGPILEFERPAWAAFVDFAKTFEV